MVGLNKDARQQRVEAERQSKRIRKIDEKADMLRDKGDHGIDSNAASVLLKKLNSNYDSVISTSVARNDAVTFNKISGLATAHVEKQSIEQRKKDIGTFLNNVINMHKARNGDAICDWNLVGQTYGHFFNGVCGNSFMYGCLDVKKKVRVVRNQKSKSNALEDVEERTAEVISQKDVAKDGTASNRKRSHHEIMQNELHNLVKAKRRRGMMELLVNPRSFTQSVENIFEYAFQIKNLSVIEIDENGLPTVRAEPAILEDSAGSSASTSDPNFKGQVRAPPYHDHQSVLSFDMSDWGEARKLFCGPEPLLSHRTSGEYKDLYQDNE